MNYLELKAKHFATLHHADQVRRYTFEPYINHPAAVVELVRSVPHTEKMLAAAWMHDLIEDTKITSSDIRGSFGNEIAILVNQVTDVSKPSDGNRAVRKAIDQGHLALASPAAKTIKLADLIDNISSIVEHDPKFAEVYLREKSVLLNVLREGNPDLWVKAKDLMTFLWLST